MAKLEEYRRKRRFDRTPEPSGEPQPVAGEVEDQPSPVAKPATAGRRTRLPKPKLPQLEVRPGAEHGDTFVVQKHRATRLHYDFRLDPVKIKRAQRVLRASTETEAIERALDLVISEHERNRLTAEANERFMTSGVDIKDVYGALEE